MLLLLLSLLFNKRFADGKVGVLAWAEPEPEPETGPDCDCDWDWIDWFYFDAGVGYFYWLNNFFEKGEAEPEVYFAG